MLFLLVLRCHVRDVDDQLHRLPIAHGSSPGIAAVVVVMTGLRAFAIGRQTRLPPKTHPRKCSNTRRGHDVTERHSTRELADTARRRPAGLLASGTTACPRRDHG